MHRLRREADDIESGDAEAGPGEGEPVLASGHARPGEDDDVEDLRENQRRDGKIDVAQPRRKIGHDHGDQAGSDEAEQDRQEKIGRVDQQQRRGRPIDAETEERRVAERDHAGVADQNIGRHGEKAPDQDFRQKAPPERRQNQRRRDQQHQDDGKSAPEDGAVALGHLGVGTKRPVGRNNSVRIRTTKETMTACEGLTQIEA